MRFGREWNKKKKKKKMENIHRCDPIGNYGAC